MAKLQLVSSKRWPAPPWSSLAPWSHGHLYSSRAMTSYDPWKNICNCNICPRWIDTSHDFQVASRDLSLSIFLWLASILCKGMQRAVLNWWYVKGMDTMAHDAHVENSECWGAHNLHILAKDPWSFGPGTKNTLTMFDPFRPDATPVLRWAHVRTNSAALRSYV